MTSTDTSTSENLPAVFVICPYQITENGKCYVPIAELTRKGYPENFPYTLEDCLSFCCLSFPKTDFNHPALYDLEPIPLTVFAKKLFSILDERCLNQVQDFDKDPRKFFRFIIKYNDLSNPLKIGIIPLHLMDAWDLLSILQSKIKYPNYHENLVQQPIKPPNALKKIKTVPSLCHLTLNFDKADSESGSSSESKCNELKKSLKEAVQDSKLHFTLPTIEKFLQRFKFEGSDLIIPLDRSIAAAFEDIPKFDHYNSLPMNKSPRKTPATSPNQCSSKTATGNRKQIHDFDPSFRPKSELDQCGKALSEFLAMKKNNPDVVDPTLKSIVYWQRYGPGVKIRCWCVFELSNSTIWQTWCLFSELLQFDKSTAHLKQLDDLLPLALPQCLITSEEEEILSEISNMINNQEMHDPLVRKSVDTRLQSTEAYRNQIQSFDKLGQELHLKMPIHVMKDSPYYFSLTDAIDSNVPIDPHKITAPSIDFVKQIPFYHNPSFRF